MIDAIKAGFQYISLRCPRRSGKSHGMTALILWFGEKFPNSRILVISLTLKSTRENYWAGAPGGIFKQAAEHALNLRYNHTDSVWYHENGSRGRLAGAETRADIEYLRGAAAEADIVVIDECKSFAPDLLTELIRDVVEPGLMTRDGTLVMGGTPGSIPMGPFYEATAEQARSDDGKPTCIPFGHESDPAYHLIPEEVRPELWCLHTWTIQDNNRTEKLKKQWKRALRTKERAGWADDHPTWRREYLGEWVTDASDLIYAWLSCRANGKKVTWQPDHERFGPSGLDPADGPWHLVLGLDLGYVDESAFVLAAYSETLKELRHVHDFKQSEMLVDDFIEQVLSMIDIYGLPEAIVADTAGGGSKMLIETLNQRYGLSIVPAEKTQKQDHWELVNADFHAERIKIIPGTDLAHELAALQFDLTRSSKIILARTGRLKEDPKCPNHLCDAFLYLYRYSYHFWSEAPSRGPDVGSNQWLRQMEKDQIQRAVDRKRLGKKDPHGLARVARDRPPNRDQWQN